MPITRVVGAKGVMAYQSQGGIPGDTGREGEREGGREGRREINLFKGKSGYRNNRRWEIMLCLKTKE